MSDTQTMGNQVSRSPRPRPVLALYKKEVRIVFDSPIAYIVAVFFLGFIGVWFFLVQEFFAYNNANLRGLFGIFPIVFLAVIPALTMRTWAEEHRQGTMELLVTLPIKEWGLVLGKYLANLTVFVFLLLGSLPIVLLVLPFGQFDPGVILTQYLGSLMLGATGLAIGQYISSLTANQVSSFLGTAGILLVFTLLDRLVISSGLGGTLGNALLSISFTYRFGGFVKGLLDTRDLLFFGLLAWAFLFMNSRSLLHQKWS